MQEVEDLVVDLFRKPGDEHGFISSTTGVFVVLVGNVIIRAYGLRSIPLSGIALPSLWSDRTCDQAKSMSANNRRKTAVRHERPKDDVQNSSKSTRHHKVPQKREHLEHPRPPTQSSRSSTSSSMPSAARTVLTKPLKNHHQNLPYKLRGRSFSPEDGTPMYPTRFATDAMTVSPKMAKFVTATSTRHEEPRKDSEESVVRSKSTRARFRQFLQWPSNGASPAASILKNSSHLVRHSWHDPHNEKKVRFEID